MCTGRRLTVVLLGFLAISSWSLFAQDEPVAPQEEPEVAQEEVAPQDSGWRISPEKILIRDEKLWLWQIHPDGTYRSILVEATKLTQQLSAPTSVVSPTSAIVTDNMNGTLIPVRMTHNRMPENIRDQSDEFIYRVNAEGDLVYKLPLPKYSGPLRDEMVIGSDEFLRLGVEC
jgi:hypothetical protein